MMALNRKRSLYYEFLWMVLLFFILIFAAGTWTVNQWRQEAQQRIDGILESEWGRVESILQGDIEKFDMLVPIVRSKQLQLVELAYNDKYDAIGIMLKDLASYFNIDLLLFYTDEGLMTSNIPGLATQFSASDDSRSLQQQLNEQTQIIQLPSMLGNLLSDQAPLFSYASSVQLEDFSGEKMGHVLMFKFLTGHQSLISVFSKKAQAEVILRTSEGKVILSTLHGGWRWLDIVDKRFKSGNKFFYTNSQPYHDINGVKLFELTVAMDQEPFEAITRQLITANIPIYLGIFIASFYMAFFMKQRIFNPINAQIKALRRVSQGDLKTRLELPRSVPQEAQDEIMRMAEDFNHMMDRLEHSYEELEEKSRQIEHARWIAEDANKAKSMFLANMSHELRTPMHGILSFAKFGREKIGKVPEEKLLFYFEQINNSGERLLTLLNDLLDLAKLESGKIDMNFKYGDLLDVIRNCVEEQAVRIEELGLSVEKHETGQVDTQTEFDTARIGQVVTNLLSNAIKFSVPQSTIRIGCKSTILDIESHTVEAIECYISNRGDQIPEKDLESIFEKFNQSEANTYVNQKGTGLGLSISHEIIQAHKGRIWAENLGTDEVIFKFIIPKRQKLINAKVA